MRKIVGAFHLLILIFINSCEITSIGPGLYNTKNVIIVTIDGPRYSETWGDTTHIYIPNMAKSLSKHGIINTNFYNRGPTYTNAGHVALTTGCYQDIDNTGIELPENPSIFQYWLQFNEHEKDSTDAWLISSKGKLEVLADCKNADWSGQFNPSKNCGINGIGVDGGSRHDSLTYAKAVEILREFNPQLVLIHFREPDYSGHGGNWNNYTKGIVDTDWYTHKIWELIETNPFYKGSTTLFVTNDHGRHLDSIANGFISHGDNCDGCRHINFFAFGPDFKQNIIIDTEREQIDISATIAELLNFKIPNKNGEVMIELFK